MRLFGYVYYPAETGPDLEKFLEITCMKTGESDIDYVSRLDREMMNSRRPALRSGLFKLSNLVARKHIATEAALTSIPPLITRSLPPFALKEEVEYSLRLAASEEERPLPDQERWLIEKARRARERVDMDRSENANTRRWLEETAEIWESTLEAIYGSASKWKSLYGSKVER